MSILSDSFQLPWLAEDEQAPLCAALSHYWASSEITHDDLLSTSGCAQKHGSSDLMVACFDALESRKLDWPWADTVCADCSSSAVLAESLSFMSRWYDNCVICLGYLDDICDDELSAEMLGGSSWLTRPWSLIELIASPRLSLRNTDWPVTEATSALTSALSRITRINQTILEDEEAIEDMSIEAQMSWVDQCSTPRVEEAAHSLFGIFGVSMRVIRSEEERIIVHLQEDFRKTLENASKFIWRVPEVQQLRQFFTRSPSEFAHCRSPNIGITWWRLPNPLQLSSLTPPSTTRHILNGSEEDVSTLHSDVPESSQCYGGLNIKLREWQGGLVLFNFQHLDDLSINTPSGTQSDTVSENADAGASEPISESVTHGPQPECSPSLGSQSESFHHTSRQLVSLPSSGVDSGLRLQDEETQLGRTEQACPPGANSSSGIAIHQDSSPGLTMDTQEAPKAKSDCDAISMDSTLEDDGSDGSDDTDDYEDSLFSCSVCDDEPMELDPVFAGLTDALAQTALDRFPGWLANILTFYEKPQNISTTPCNKRIKSETFSNHVEVDSSRLEEDEEDMAMETPGSRRFACPFSFHGRTQYPLCFTRTDLRTIRDLKEHLCLSHRQPYYCPTCSITFPLASSRDDHIKSRTCNLQEWKGAPQGLSQYQLQRLTKRCKPGTSEMNQWYDIWNLIYSEEGTARPQEEPRTPYLTGVVESAVSLVRDFWMQKGRFIIADFLEQRGLRGYEVRDEERNLAALYQTTLNNVVDLVVRIVGGSNTHLDRSDAVRNILSAIRKLCPGTI